MYDIKVLNNKCKMGGGNVGPQCFVKGYALKIISAYIIYDSNIK
jgi:hypothetical protein